MKLLKLFQINTQNIFEIDRTEQNLYDIVTQFRALLKIPDTVKIKIRWGRKAKRVLGSVRLLKDVSVIRISQYLADFNVPDYVLEEVILHEMIHIKTGYGSSIEKQYKNAHRGGIIRKEMDAVGKAQLYDESDAWVKKNWYKHVRNYNRNEKFRLLRKKY